MPLSASAADFLRGHVRAQSAIVLDASKSYLLELRLQPLVARARLASLDELAERVRRDPTGTLSAQVVEALCTNETSFFRDPPVFELLRRRVLPELVAARARERRLRIWCGACASGQEPYSLAMLLVESFPELASWRVELLATDLSEAMLERAREGVFSQFEVGRGLPSTLLVKHFEQRGCEWRIREELRRRVEFRRINLARPLDLEPGYDLVLLRNVLIYFDLDVRAGLLRRVREVLHPSGYLLLGSAENTLRVDVGLERIGDASCYRRAGTRAA